MDMLLSIDRSINLLQPFLSDPKNLYWNISSSTSRTSRRHKLIRSAIYFLINSYLEAKQTKNKNSSRHFGSTRIKAHMSEQTIFIQFVITFKSSSRGKKKLFFVANVLQSSDSPSSRCLLITALAKSAIHFLWKISFLIRIEQVCDKFFFLCFYVKTC